MQNTSQGRSLAQAKKTTPRARIYKLLSFYPPYIGAGIRVKYVAPDFEVRMDLTWFNRNAVGTHFGGSLYAMCDPFFMLILMEQLGADYIVWDKAAEIQFIRPGRGTVYANFHIPPEVVAEIRTRADQGEKIEPLFHVDVVDKDNQVIARVEKRLYVRTKNGKADR